MEAEVDDPYTLRNWPDGDADPTYYVIEDQYNETEGYVYLEILKREGLNNKWLSGVLLALESYPSWGVCLNNIEQGYLIIFSDRMLIAGQAFADSDSLGDVLHAARESLFT